MVVTSFVLPTSAGFLQQCWPKCLPQCIERFLCPQPRASMSGPRREHQACYLYRRKIVPDNSSKTRRRRGGEVALIGCLRCVAVRVSLIGYHGKPCLDHPYPTGRAMFSATKIDTRRLIIILAISALFTQQRIFSSCGTVRILGHMDLCSP